MKTVFKREFPSLFRVKRGEEKRKRRADNSIRQRIIPLKSLITNVVNSRSCNAPASIQALWK